MTMAIWALATYSIVATATQLGSILIATSKCRKPRSISRPAKSQTALGLVRLTRYLRPRLCPGQVDALSAQPDRTGRRHSIARGRGRGGRGHDQARARLGASRSPRRRAVRATPRPPLRGRSMGASTAVGAAAAGLVSEYYALEILAGGFGPLTAAAYVVAALDLPLGSVVALAAIWYGAEAALARAAGWHLSLKSPAAWMLRDALLPLLWIGGWLGRGFVWRGNEMRPLESRGAI